MSGRIRSVGHGLLAAGVVLVAIYFFGVYLKGSDAVRDALSPFVLRNYLAFVPVAIGAFLIWLGGRMIRSRTSSD